jgi:NAD(P)-dependent dehydrogenase (short-subunit alcohol dehydrogenase family)
MFSLEGKVALITGGGRGIGKAMTELFVEAGAKVVIASRKAEVLTATVNELKSKGTLAACPCHVGRAEEIQQLVAFTEKLYGPIDVLVNNSATNLGQGPALAGTDEMLDKMIDVNIKAAFRLVRLVAPKMMDRGGGSIINIASVAGLRPQQGGLLYSMTKAALIMMTRSWAEEFGPRNLRVNAIAPGLIQTDFSEFFWKNDDFRKGYEEASALKRIGQPTEIAPLALFLASEAGSFVTGQVIAADAGFTAI